MKVLAFDLGGVIFNFDYRIALRKIKGKIGVSEDKIIEELFYKDFALDYEKGLISSYDFYHKFKNAFKATLDYEEFTSVWSQIFSPDEEIIDLIERLRLLYPVYLISNINELHFNYLYQKFEKIFSLFDALILSFKVNSVKPEAEIYKKLEAVSRCRAKDILYIDDREDLIIEANKLNFKCIQFRNITQLLKSLEREGVYVVCDEERDALLELRDRLSQDTPLLVGVGHPLKGDDAAGALIVRELNRKIHIPTLFVEDNLQNYLNKIKGANPVVIIDTAFFPQDTRFKCFSSKEIEESSLSLTHNLSLKILTEYLQTEAIIDILILGIKGYNVRFNAPLSRRVKEAKAIITEFFIRNFSK